MHNEMLLKGMLTGFILVVPGMSGGTLLLLPVAKS